MSRSPAEVLFRLRQETANLQLWLAPPDWPSSCLAGGDLPLPSIGEIRPLVSGTRYEEKLYAVADRCAAGELPVFGQWINPGSPVRWRNDYQHNRETPPAYFRRVPYLDFEKAGDHKWIWEINRHQHLVLLAQAWALNRQPRYVEAIAIQLETWLEANPPQCGINWASALEVAIRALSWIWVLHFAGEALPEQLRQRVLASLRAHGRHLAANLSVYFSPNTHLLGEALTLHALGRFLRDLPEAAGWLRRGAYWMRECLQRQVKEDGSYFEQSSYYHVYAFDMFMLHAIWEPGARMDPALDRMADFTAALLGEDGCMPLIGDDDGGRLFHPFGPRNEFGRGSMAVYAALRATVSGSAGWLDQETACDMSVWWLGVRASRCWEAARRSGAGSRLFPSAGWAVLCGSEIDAIVDAGPFGPGSGGHSHADTLSLTLRRQGREVLIDPGTYTYLSDPLWRERFRGVSAHNTISIDGLPQADPAGPFRWARMPSVQLLAWQTNDERDILDAICQYSGVRHRRLLHFEKEKPRLWIADWIEGGPFPGPITQYWHLAEEPKQLGPACFSSAGARITLDERREVSIEQEWRSSILGKRDAAPVLAVRWMTKEPFSGSVAVIDWLPEEGALGIDAIWTDNQVTITTIGAHPDRLVFTVPPHR